MSRTRELFAELSAHGAVSRELSDAAWLSAFIDFEVAVAHALAQTGIVPEAAAEALAAAVPTNISLAELAAGTGKTGSPIPAFVKQLESSLPPTAARALHHGATSQDVLDTALMLIAKRALAHILADLDAAAASAAELARRHRGSVMLGRTLLQPATPITFGFKAAGWLWALNDARARLSEARGRLPLQCGGATGTLAPLGARGVEVAGLMAVELGLTEPVLPWHTLRAPILELTSACGIAGTALGKIARDISLLAQAEVSELAEPVTAGRGASSTMPHKQNPVGSVAVLSCTRRIPGLLATMFVAAEQEHERAAGAWHAEWETLTELLSLLGSAASWMREVLAALSVDTERMRANFDAARGLPLAERLKVELMPRLGRERTEALLQTAIDRARREQQHLREVLSGDTDFQQALQEAGIGPELLARAFEPSGYLGSSSQFIDRALELYESRTAARVERAPAALAEQPARVEPAAASDRGHASAGEETRRSVLGDAHVDRALAATTDFTAPFQDFITRHVWGEIWNRPGLSRAERSLITLSALATLSHHDELALHLRGALRNGLSVEQIRELFLQLAVYAGVPAANQAFAIAQKVLSEP